MTNQGREGGSSITNTRHHACVSNLLVGLLYNTPPKLTHVLKRTAVSYEKCIIQPTGQIIAPQILGLLLEHSVAVIYSAEYRLTIHRHAHLL